jgi:dTDP-4-dehydrorhamnose reductase
MEPIRMLLTGGSGFLGSVLALRSAAAGYRVWATHLSNPVPDHPGVTPVRVDLTDSAALVALVREVAPSVVVHTAYSMTDAAVNIGCGRELSAACTELASPPFFIFTSTDLIFDGSKGMYTERDQPAPVMEYGCQKLATERAVKEHLPSAAIVRPSLIYDLERLPLHLQFALQAQSSGRTFEFFTDEFRSPVHVDDLAAMIIELCDRCLGGLWHAGGADRVDRWWFGTHLLRALGHTTSLARRGRAAELAGIRPADCSLDSARAAGKLETVLRGAVEVLGKFDGGNDDE